MQRQRRHRQDENILLRPHDRLCRKTPSSAREREIFRTGKDGEAGDIGFIVDAAGRRARGNNSRSKPDRVSRHSPPQLGETTHHNVDFLIHDSIIYDGVDPRQRAHALEQAATVTEQNNLQYICALNSDMIPTKDLSPGVNLDQYIRVRLTDKEPAGSSLGMRFGQRKCEE